MPGVLLKRQCRGPECQRLVDASQGTGLCRSHYKQWHLSKELTPLRVATKDLGRPEICVFPGCSRPHKARGYCKAHNQLIQAGQPLRPIQERRPPGPCEADGCDRPRHANDLCARHNASRYTRWRAYGITPENGAAMYEAQGRACAICRVPADLDDLHIDHDHSCCPDSRRGCGSCVRGLLCQPCNIGLGYMRDDVARLRAAAEYLARSDSGK